MATELDYSGFSGFGVDVGKDAKLLGRLKLPYKSFNFLAILSKQFGKDKYDRARDLIELCQWMYVHVSDVRNIINRISEYAITDIQIDYSKSKLPKDDQEELLELLEHLNLKSKLVQIAKLYFATGNALVSVELRFKKHLECVVCKNIFNINKLDFTFNPESIVYSAQCPTCKVKRNMNVLDIKSRTVQDTYIKIWDWHDIEFEHNPISDEYRYYYKIPIDIYNALNTKTPDRFFLETTPIYILKEIFSKKQKNNNTLPTKKRLVGFPPRKLKHIKNDSTLNVVMGGWGEPLLMGVLQDVFFMQLLRQAQATILADYVVPIRVVSPDPKASELMDIKKFAAEFDKLYAEFKRDPLQIMKAPFPIQYQTMSGEGKTLFLSNEMDYTRNSIRRGLGVPAELLDGGLQSYSAGSVALRLLENFLSNFINSIVYSLVNEFLLPSICVILNLPKFKVSFSNFKALDDNQQKASKLNLYQLNLIPDTDLYEDYGVKRPTEVELQDSIKRRATRDGNYQLTVGKYQSEMQSDTLLSNTQAQIEAQRIQLKEEEIKQAKLQQSQADAAAGTQQTGAAPSDDTAASGGSGATQQRQDPKELGEYALQQLHTPEEIDAFMDVLKQSVPDDLNYVKQVEDYIRQNSGQSPVVSQQVSEKTKPKSDGLERRNMPVVKPPRRQT